MIKIHYNEEGWLCNRVPTNYEITDPNRYILVDEITYTNTLATPSHQSWRVKDGKLYLDHYEEEPEEEILQRLRFKREECFEIINRGKLWYDTLSETQIKELKEWYKNWLDVTKTKTIPQKPEWL